jgi:hypothetical protein
MDKPDSHPGRLDNRPFRQPRLEIWLVHVSVDSLDRGVLAQLLEHCSGREVTHV